MVETGSSRSTDVDRLREDIVFTETLRGHTFEFHTRWGLFSPRSIDEGTRLLVDQLDVREMDRCLDLGCGYGPIGLTMARLAPRGEAWLVDRDFLAVDYARANAERNGIENVHALLSDGFSHLPPDLQFDVVASNLPAKAGNEAFAILFADAHERLAAGGRFYVVTLSNVRGFIERSFRARFGNYDKLKQGRAYTVSLAVKE